MESKMADGSGGWVIARDVSQRWVFEGHPAGQDNATGFKMAY